MKLVLNSVSAAACSYRLLAWIVPCLLQPCSDELCYLETAKVSGLCLVSHLTRAFFKNFILVWPPFQEDFLRMKYSFA